VSAAVKKVLGYNQNDLLGIPFRAFVHPDDVHIIDKAEKSHRLDSTQTTINDEYRFRNAQVNGGGSSPQGLHRVKKTKRFLTLSVSQETSLNRSRQKKKCSRLPKNG